MSPLPKSLRDTALIAAGNLAGFAGCLVFAASAVSAPVLGAATAAWGARAAYRAFRAWRWNKKHNKHGYANLSFLHHGMPLVPFEPAARMAERHARTLGIKPPIVTAQTENRLLRENIAILPRFMRKLILDSHRKNRQGELGKLLKYEFAAATNNNVLRVPPSAIYYEAETVDSKRKLHPAQLEFIIAHEAMHLLYDKPDLAHPLKGLVNPVLLTCAGLGCVAGLMPLIGFSLPILVFAAPGPAGIVGSLGMLLGAKMAASAGFRFASRVMEARADRGALELTKNPLAATLLIVGAHSEKMSFSELTLKPEYLPKSNRITFEDILSRHPAYGRRLDNLGVNFRALAGQSLPPPNLPSAEQAFEQYVQEEEQLGRRPRIYVTPPRAS